MTRLRCVAVDLTNGSALDGADGMARAAGLVQQMAERAPETRFEILKVPRSTSASAAGLLARLFRAVRRPLASLLPLRVVQWAEAASIAAVHWPPRSRAPTHLGADVVFCPLVGPSLHDPALPLVCGVDSLAQRAYPESFDVAETIVRNFLLRRAVRLSARLVCPSEFVRDSLLETTRLAPERVVVIRPDVPAPPPDDPARRQDLLGQLGVLEDGFLLCPAPFVAYENHRLLLTAFGMYRARHPASTLKLVCAGRPGGELSLVRHSIQTMRLADRATLCADLPQTDVLRLYQSCRGVVLPGLYDASGHAALVGLAVGAPILCSGAGALREVVGDAGVSFDPRLPEALVEAIALADDQPAAYRALRDQGPMRAAELRSPQTQAEQYLRLLQGVV